MSDTTLRDCIICEEEGDCIEGICSNCAAEDDLTHYMSATSRLSKKVEQLQIQITRIEQLKEHYKSIGFHYTAKRIEQALKV